jgi:uncharacterized membrane protein
MKNVIVASFQEESKAITALHKLTELDSFGDITIYDQIMVRKQADGKLKFLKQANSEGWMTLTGMGLGSLLGLLTGPVGFVIGLYTGTAIGAIAEVSHYDFADDFVAKIGKKIEVGTVTIIAEIEEDSELFIDNYLKPLGAEIWRSDVDLEFDKLANEQIDEIEAEIAEEREELKKVVGEEKEKIEKRIADLKEKRKTKITEFVAKSKQLNKDLKAKAANDAAQIKADFKAIGTAFSEEMKRDKIAHIQKRIGKHEEMLNELNVRLGELQA